MYGGPSFQAVDKQWTGYEFGAYIASAFNVVYAKIDPRGSGLQVKYLFNTQVVRIIDININISAVRYLT